MCNKKCKCSDDCCQDQENNPNGCCQDQENNPWKNRYIELLHKVAKFSMDIGYSMDILDEHLTASMEKCSGEEVDDIRTQLSKRMMPCDE